MRCDRCGKTITEQTALIYHGSCVPCHRQRAAQRLARTVRGTWTRIRDLITVPFQIVHGIPGLLRLRFAQLPVSRREVLKTLEPVFGCSGAQLFSAVSGTATSAQATTSPVATPATASVFTTAPLLLAASRLGPSYSRVMFPIRPKSANPGAARGVCRRRPNTDAVVHLGTRR
jgi:hypothetical protein